MAIIFIVRCLSAASASLDTSDVWGLTLGSGKTFEQAITEHGVFGIVGMVLVKARFVLEKKSDYAGFGLLLAVGMLPLCWHAFSHPDTLVHSLQTQGTETWLICSAKDQRW
jgi:hypothetical protein